MSITPRLLANLTLGLFVSVVATLNAGTVQGFVKGPDGKPIGGAEVHVAQSKAQGVLQKVMTDKNGSYIFKNLADDKAYTLTAWVNKVPTSIGNVKARSEGAIRVDFDIKANAAAAKKKAKHWVYMPATTGSHMGGRWVEVDENGTTSAEGQPVQSVSGKALEQAYRNHSGY